MPIYIKCITTNLKVWSGQHASMKRRKKRASERASYQQREENEKSCSARRAAIKLLHDNKSEIDWSETRYWTKTIVLLLYYQKREEKKKDICVVLR